MKIAILFLERNVLHSVDGVNDERSWSRDHRIWPVKTRTYYERCTIR